MINHNDFIKQYIKEISKEKKVLDVGGGKRFLKWLKEYEPLFKDCDYKTFDCDASGGADIIGDIHNMPIEDNSIDAIICSSVLEHVENPIKAVKEMRRVLKKDGKIFVYIPSIYPYHARQSGYRDYWRFFDDTVELLFKDFKDIKIEKRGGYFTALSFFFPKQDKIRRLLDLTSRAMDTFLNTKSRTTTAGYYIYAKK